MDPNREGKFSYIISNKPLLNIHDYSLLTPNPFALVAKYEILAQKRKKTNIQ